MSISASDSQRLPLGGQDVIVRRDFVFVEDRPLATRPTKTREDIIPVARRVRLCWFALVVAAALCGGLVAVSLCSSSIDPAVSAMSMGSVLTLAAVLWRANARLLS